MRSPLGTAGSPAHEGLLPLPRVTLFPMLPQQAACRRPTGGSLSPVSAGSFPQGLWRTTAVSASADAGMAAAVWTERGPERPAPAFPGQQCAERGSPRAVARARAISQASLRSHPSPRPYRARDARCLSHRDACQRGECSMEKRHSRSGHRGVSLEPVETPLAQINPWTHEAERFIRNLQGHDPLPLQIPQRGAPARH
jgi:hypothetical protein